MGLLDRFSTDPTGAILYLAGLIVAFTFHELGHAWTAVWEGDDTPLNEGRLTLNPLRHIEPIGLLLIVFAGFGWARPVMTRPDRYRHGRLGEVLVSLAGVIANLLLAVLVLLALRFLGDGIAAAPGVVRAALLDFFLINVMLLVFNLLPVPPLDGSHVLAALVPGELGRSLRYHASRSFYLALIVVLLFREQIGSLIIGTARFLMDLILL
ncbi:MAG TPA: site-2 protease family protein [Deinococcales bacterium]|nr:site-2 protease family protein [Deinococcales bacterium]